MCGIAGFLSFSVNFSKPDLENMTNALAHRGPNAAGFYFNDKVGLGHRRLSIIDLTEAANQPMHSQCGRYVIVFNGEIYNYREIARELKVTLKTTSDTEVLLESFIQFGTGFVNKLNGMFAFVIYDTKEAVLYVYRDRMGIKPIYYYHDETNFIFASELKSFDVLPNIYKGGTNKQAINDFLYLGYIPAPLSIYNNIKKFPSGSYAVIGKNKFEIQSYWKLEEQIERKVITNIKEAKNRLNELLISSVQYRMISDVPLGTFLSGGIDSSLVTALAQKISDRPVKTFTIGFKEGKFNEADYARAVAKHLKTEHYEKELTYNDALELFETALNIYDEPFADSSSFPTLLVSKFAREQVAVILSGDGGDETHLGYGAYEWGKRLSNPLLKTFRKQVAFLLRKGNNRQKRASYLFDYKDESRIKSNIFSQEQYCFSEQEIQILLQPSQTTSFSIQEHIALQNRSLSFVEQQALFDLQYYLQDDLLVKVDRASMHHALEVRVPLLDYRLVHFALNLSEDLRKQKGVTKYLLKEVLFDMVPKELFERPKWGFSIPLIEWLKNDWRFLIDTYLNKSTIEETAVLNFEVAQQYVKRFQKGENYLYNRIWLMLVLQMNLKKIKSNHE